MRFQVVGRLSALDAGSPSVLDRAPWLYAVCAPKHRLLYVGETWADGGLVSRIGQHLGPGAQSTLRERAAAVLGVVRVEPPYIVVGASLAGSDTFPFDGTSRVNRQAAEGLLHDYMQRASVLVGRERFRIVSSTRGSSAVFGPRSKEACQSLSACVDTALQEARGLASASPFQIVVVAPEVAVFPEDSDWKELVEEFEFTLFDWVRSELVKVHGDRWWLECVPKPSRTQCAMRHADESQPESVHHAAFLNLIDLRAIARGNWSVFEQTMQSVARCNGKDAATKWLITLNDIRKLAAHPIKRAHMSVPPADVTMLRGVRQRFRVATGR